MRKKLALLLAAIMVIGMIPMTAFATTTNRMTKVVTGKEDTVLKVEDAPVLRIYEKDLADVTTGQAFELQLTNAEWASDAKGADKDYAPLARKIEEMSESVKTVKITELTSKNIIVKVQEFV